MRSCLPSSGRSATSPPRQERKAARTNSPGTQDAPKGLPGVDARLQGGLDSAPVFTGQRGPLTCNGIWRMVEGRMAAVGLDPRYATHSSWHTYETHLYRGSGNDLEIVQLQLGHASFKHDLELASAWTKHCGQANIHSDSHQGNCSYYVFGMGHSYLPLIPLSPASYPGIRKIRLDSGSWSTQEHPSVDAGSPGPASREIDINNDEDRRLDLLP